MKYLKKFFVLFFVAIFICGCSIKTEVSMNIKNDKSMDFSYLIALDDELINAAMSMQNSIGTEDSENNEVKEYTEEEKWKFIEDEISEQYSTQGFQKEKYEQDGYRGFRFTKKISNIDYISGDEINFNFSDFSNIDKSIVFIKDGDTYTAKFSSAGIVNENSQDLDGSSQPLDENSQDFGEGTQDMPSIKYDTKFIVTLPNKSISNNADEVSKDGKTLIWDLSSSEDKDLNFSFKFSGISMDTIVYIVLGVLIIGISIGILFVIKKGKHNKSNLNKSNNVNDQNFDNNINEIQGIQNQQVNMMNQTPIMPEQQINTMNQTPIMPDQQLNIMNQTPIMPDQQVNMMNQTPTMPNQQVNMMNQTPIMPDQQINMMNQTPIMPDQQINAMNQPNTPQEQPFDVNAMIEQSLNLNNTQNNLNDSSNNQANDSINM